MRSTLKFALVMLLAFAPMALAAQGEQGIPTRIIVRAVSHDAKVIGSKVGGARIIIQDVKTGRILASGLQEGGTGDTELIMKTPHTRGESIYTTPGTAAFEATLMLHTPTVVQITAIGPLGTPQAIQKVSKTLLLVPGKDVLGEGVILEIHGFRVEALSPKGDMIHKVGQELQVQAKVTMT